MGRWSAFLLLSLSLGCASLPSSEPPVSQASSAPTETIQRVAFEQPPSSGDTLPEPHRIEDPSPNVPFAGSKELSVEAVVAQVLARNPSLAQMTAAWKAAQARYPQVTSLDDPLFGGTVAPASLGDNANGNTSGYRFEVFQRYPFPGKRRLRGEKALAEAHAVGRDVENTRVQLVESAREAFYDYYLASRALEINEEGLKLLREFRQDAETRYKTGRGPQQDVTQAGVEIGRQRQRLLTLQRMRQVAVARINTLMHLPPASPLPPPPKELAVPRELPEAQQMLATALNQRLDLLALKDRIVAAEAAVKLAQREYYPDFDAMAAYDNFWTQGTLRPQIALRINLPVRQARRDAALAEAKARLAELHAEYDRQTDVVGYEVQQVYEQLRESYETVRLFEGDVLPAARANLESAQAAYTVGKGPLSSLIAAERDVVNLRDQYYEALTELFRRRTVLERSLSGSPPAAPIPTPPRQPGPGQPGYPTSLGP
jgi:outer membrane protein TolC